MSAQPTMHDRAAAERTLEVALREILREPGNRVRTIAIATTALDLVGQNIPRKPLASGSTIPTPHSVKAPVADREVCGED